MHIDEPAAASYADTESGDWFDGDLDARTEVELLGEVAAASQRARQHRFTGYRSVRHLHPGRPGSPQHKRVGASRFRPGARMEGSF